MINLATLLAGPLAGPECRRALGRGWVILVRALAALAVLGVAAIVLWLWWIGQRIDPNHRPLLELRIGLEVVEGMLVTIALVLAPAVLAGSLAGERERGALALLMTTRVSAFEVVAGRLAGKLTQVGMILLGGAPAVVLLAAMAGMSPATILAGLLLPVAVGFGGGGLAVAASTLSRRGRDALLSVYLIDLFLLLAPGVALFGPGAVVDWAIALNPYNGLDALAKHEAVGPAWASIALWMAIGLAGDALASWRLRPSCLAQAEGARVGRGLGRGSGRRGLVPVVDEDRPMLWKELFIERVATLGRFGRWVGLLLVVGLAGGSVGLTAVFLWDVFSRGQTGWADWSLDWLGAWVGASGGYLSCLIQWAIGLRAAVSISSERERGTWDALLTSPLTAREIVRAKLWGSLYAIRWLIAAAVLAWALAAGTGAIRLREPVTWTSEVLVMGAFMAAVGVRTSLSCRTATRAMSVTIGAWLVAYVAVAVLSGIIIASMFLALNSLRLAASQFGVIPPMTGMWSPMPMWVAWPLTNLSVYFGLTLTVVGDTRLRFDRIAGRMTEGALSVAVDNLLHGRASSEGIGVDFGPDYDPRVEVEPTEQAPVPAADVDPAPATEPVPAADQRRGEAVAGSS